MRFLRSQGPYTTIGDSLPSTGHARGSCFCAIPSCVESWVHAEFVVCVRYGWEAFHYVTLFVVLRISASFRNLFSHLTAKKKREWITLLVRVTAALFMSKASGSVFPRSTGKPNHCDRQENGSDLRDRVTSWREYAIYQIAFLRRIALSTCYSLRFCFSLCRTRRLAVCVFCRQADARALFIRSAASTRANTINRSFYLALPWRFLRSRHIQRTKQDYPWRTNVTFFSDRYDWQ